MADPEPSADKVEVEEDAVEPVTDAIAEDDAAPVTEPVTDRIEEATPESVSNELEAHEPATASVSEDIAPSSETWGQFEPEVAEPSSMLESARSDREIAPEGSAPVFESLGLAEPDTDQVHATPLPAPDAIVPVIPMLAIDGEPHQEDLAETTEAEQPRSGSHLWTPSYSVINQGPDTAEAEKEPKLVEDDEDFIPPPPLPSLKVLHLNICRCTCTDDHSSARYRLRRSTCQSHPRNRTRNVRARHGHHHIPF